MLDEEALLVGGLTAHERGGALARLLERRGGLLERPLPGDLAQVAAVAHERRGDPLGRVNRLVGKAALVAEPAVVHLGVVAREDADDLGVVPDRELDVALARAQRAQRTCVLDVPGPCAEAVGGRGERAHRAELDDVAAERRDVGAAVVGAYEGVVASLEEHQLVVLGHLLREADAAVAEDAALAVDRDQRRQLERLLEVALWLDEARAAGAPAEGDVLKRALAALVADRAVERVVHEQELDYRVLSLLDVVGGGVHHHPVLDRRGAGGLELRHALDLDEAHAARAHRLAQLGFVAEVGDLDVALLGGVHEHLALGRAHLAPVDLEDDLARLGAGHLYAGPASTVAASSPAENAAASSSCLRSRAAAMCSSNSARKCLIIEPIGIAIESPSTHRQLPMMFSWTWAMISRSIGVASPSSIRSSIFTVQLVPSRQGTHLPQDSWR